MDTILIIRDSVATCTKCLADNYQPCVNSGVTGISWQETVVTGLLIVAFVVLILVASKWLEKGWNDGKKAGNNGGQCDLDKQISHLQDLYFKHLQTMVYIDKIDDGGNKIKEYNAENAKTYQEALEKTITELKSQKNDTKKD